MLWAGASFEGGSCSFFVQSGYCFPLVGPNSLHNSRSGFQDKPRENAPPREYRCLAVLFLSTGILIEFSDIGIGWHHSRCREWKSNAYVSWDSLQLFAYRENLHTIIQLKKGPAFSNQIRNFAWVCTLQPLGKWSASHSNCLKGVSCSSNQSKQKSLSWLVSA